MIPKSNRFSGRSAINYVYKKGKSVRDEKIALRFIESHKDDYRLAVVVSKKTSKSAVYRNRIRRRLFEAFRTYRKEHNKPMAYDVIISVFSDEIAAMPADELRSRLEKLLAKSSIS